MKEATGELNMTVITVVAIAAVAAIFYAFIWPNIEVSMILGTACSQTGGLSDPENDENSKYTVTCSMGQCQAEINGRARTKVCSQVNK